LKANHNLLDNAIKFTKEGFIEIGIKTTRDFVQFQVKDTGIGIPKEFHDTIFERFRQVESANTRKYGGNGLGLAISKSLIELLGGTIWTESEEGKGSAFYFTIPIGNN
jgi:signal transduction histidine kinase